MKRLFLFLFSLVILSSCQKEEDFNSNISPYQNYDVTIDQEQMDVQGFNGTQWVITQITYTDLITETHSDTLTFNGLYDYTFGNYPSTYSFYSTPTNFKLELYDTPWGNIVGTLYNYNMNNGVIEGLVFKDLMDNSKTYKVWMYRIS